MKHLINTVLFVLTCKLCLANDIKFYSINELYGISQRESTSLCYDDKGFVWGTSKTGILRLSDSDYRLYALPNKKTSFINMKLVYNHAQLLAYSQKGQLYPYNPTSDRFDYLINISSLAGDPNLYIHNILIDQQHRFWIATSSGLYVWDHKRLKHLGDCIDMNYITWESDTLLIGANAFGMHRIDITNETIQLFHRFEPNHHRLFSKMYYDSIYDKLWIGTFSNGLLCYDFSTQILRETCLTQTVSLPTFAVHPNSDTTLLIGVDGQGITQIDRKTGLLKQEHFLENTSDPYSLHGNGVYDIICDNNQRVWIATYSKGISFFDQASSQVIQLNHRMNQKQSLCNNFVNRIHVDKMGNCWFATNNGLCKWNEESGMWSTFFHNEHGNPNVFLCVTEDANGHIWAGTYGAGIFILDAETGRNISKFDVLTSTQIKSNFVFEIFSDSNGDIWTGGIHSRVSCFDLKKQTIRMYNSHELSAIFELRPGMMLLACSDGLRMLDKRTGEEQMLLGEYLINDLVVLGDEIWLATKGDGLVQFNLIEGNIQSFTMENGLPSNFVNGILNLEDQLWLGTEAGLCTFNPIDYVVQTFESIVPLSDATFNSKSRSLLKDGKTMWGTMNGALLINTNTLQNLKTRGNLYFQDLLISGRSIKSHADIPLSQPLDQTNLFQLNYKQNNLTFELIPLGVNTSDSKLSWFLEGVDTKWNSANNTRFIQYTNLPHGDYTLKLRLYDGSALNILAERKIKWSIIPPFWRRAWFILTIIALVCILIYFALKYYINQLKQKQAEEKMRFFSNTMHDIRTSLTLISAPIEELYKGVNNLSIGKYYVRLVQEQSKRLTQIITRLMDFQKLDIGKEQLSIKDIDVVKLIQLQVMMYESLANNKKINVDFQSNQSSYFCGLDEVMMEKVVSNLLSNAIKYAYANTTVRVVLTCSDSRWNLAISDQGIGISQKGQQQLFNEFFRGENAINNKVEGSGLGLLMSKKYVQLHQGEISCTSTLHVGSTFQITIPHRIAVEADAEAFPELHIQPNDSDFIDMGSDAATKKMNILVVDDNYDLRNFIKVALGDDFEVDMAENGEDAWNCIQKKMPDLLISDIIMPNMNGFELCRLIKSTPQTSHIPVILLTVLSEQAEQLHGLGLGADDYLTKPFDISLLLQRIKNIIHNREIIREKAYKLMEGVQEEPIFINDNNDQFIKKAVNVVRKHLDVSTFGKDDFAAEMNVSSSVLYRKIKSLTGFSPVDFIKTMRLNHALELLKQNRLSITEISEKCGFSSLAYFSNVFHTFFGKAPSDYIKK